MSAGALRCAATLALALSAGSAERARGGQQQAAPTNCGAVIAVPLAPCASGSWRWTIGESYNGNGPTVHWLELGDASGWLNSSGWCDSVLKMMDFVLKTMDFVLKTMDLILKKGRCLRSHTP